MWESQGGGLPTDQISKLKKAGPPWEKMERGGKSLGRERVFPRDATWPPFPRIGVFLHAGPGGSPGGGSYQISKLSNYQINKLTKGGLVGLSRREARKAFIGTFTRFHRGRDLDAVASDLRF